MLPYSQLRSATPRIDLAASAPLPKPLSIIIEPTNACNFSCSFCVHSFSDYKDVAGIHYLSLQDFDRIAQQIEDLGGVKAIYMHNCGEALLNRNFTHMIKRARELCDRLTLTTNGSLLKGEVAQGIIDAKPDYVRVSIYGPTNERHAEITHSSVSLDRIADNLRAFMERREGGVPHLFVKMITQGEEYDRMFLERFSQLADEVDIEPLMNWNEPEEGNLSGVSHEQLMSTQYYSGQKAVCPSPFYTLVVNSDLKATVCCVDWDKQTVVGDLRTQTILEVWRGEELRRLQTTMLERRRSELPGCAACTFLYTFPDNIDGLTPEEFDRRHSQPCDGAGE